MMSEKIVITVEQNERIEAFLKVATKKGHVLINHIDGWVSEENKKLNTLTIDQMARILYEPNSYEVEKPKFEVGDIVIGLETGRAYRITSVGKHIHHTERMNGGKKSSVATDLIRHATKEEIFWAELGREVGEFVDDDLIVTDDRNLRVVTMQGVSGSAKKLYENGSVTGFYPANSFIKLP